VRKPTGRTYTRTNCVQCGRPAMSNGLGRPWKKICAVCFNAKRSPYKKIKGPVCILCGFVPIDSCQLDVDHIDGNKKNNNIENLQTLCANCHRVKTKLNAQYDHSRHTRQPLNINISLIINSEENK